jgi:hypothetical protein
MYSKVTVTADENGNVIGIFKNNPEYGYVRVEQATPVVSDRGWLKVSKRSSFIKGKVDQLQSLNYRQGQEILGKIVVIESLTPFNMDNPDRDLKIAGDTGVICRIDDQPIYRQAFYTTNTNAQDELIYHTNVDEIKEVQAAQKAMTSLKSASSRKTDAPLDL